MITFDDWDDSQQKTEKIEYELPEKVERIEVSHDGGRIEISINGKQAFYRCYGTRDCSIKINQDK